jgi:pimeloyl-ACP methyl ester carboxylesterase
MRSTDAVVKTDQTLQLPDGRTLGFAEYGSPAGDVLVYCHGYPGSRLEAAILSAHAAAAQVRVLSLDRPGFGRSSFHEGRSLLDWPHDLVALTEHLGIGRFAVMGASGGAPYALACARQIPAHLLSCGIVSTIAPVALATNWQNRVVVFLVQRTPWLFTRLLGATARSFRDERHAKEALTKTARHMGQPDREALFAQGVVDGQLDELAASAREAYRQGVRGAVSEARLYARDWGFRLEDIAFQPLYLWHGVRDTHAPIEIARAVAGKLARCQATYYPDEGHFSTLLNHQPEFFASLFSPSA